MSQITTHVLDVSTGKPAAGVRVILEKQDANQWMELGSGTTDTDGRISTLLGKTISLENGFYRLIFETGNYFSNHSIVCLHPRVLIEFAVTDPIHYHIPLLISPFGYTTYRGS